MFARPCLPSILWLVFCFTRQLLFDKQSNSKFEQTQFERLVDE